MKKEVERTHVTPRVLAQQIGAAHETILQFIHSGELEATNLGRASRPRWRISQESVESFLKARSNRANSKNGTKPKPRREPAKRF